MRTGAATDLKPAHAIEQAVALSPWSLSQFLNLRLQANTGFLVAENGEKELLGFALFQRVLDEMTLLNIAVHPDAQCRGVGRALLAAVIAEGRAQAAARLLLEVRASNVTAIRLYQREGFIDDGMRKGYYRAAGGREDARLMSLTLMAE